MDTSLEEFQIARLLKYNNQYIRKQLETINNLTNVSEIKNCLWNIRNFLYLAECDENLRDLCEFLFTKYHI